MAMRSRRRDVDVAVLGGGPAGSFAALTLVRRGLSVALIDPDIATPRLEGLSPRVVDILRQHGLEQALDEAPQSVPRLARWNGTTTARNVEHLVERAAFDHALRFAAAAAGVVCLIDRVRRLCRRQDSIRVELEQGGAFSARLAIDARGRRAPRAPCRWRGPATLSVGRWLVSAGRPPATQIAACRDGWLWCADAGASRTWVQATFDTALLPGRGRAAVQRCLQILLDQAQAQSGLKVSADGDWRGPVVVRNADTLCNAAQFDPQMIRIGDAAMGMDPLSGHGLFWALSSALSTAPIVTGLLDDPADGGELARRFYESRLAGTFWCQARLGRDFYRSEQRFGASRFWQRRQGWPDDRPAHDDAVAPSFSRRVVIDDNRLREAEVLVTAQEPDGVAWVAGLPIASIARRCLEQGLRGEQAVESFRERCAPEATVEQAAICFAWLRARGLLTGGADANFEGRGA